MALMYPRTVRIRSSSGTVNEYVRVVEAYREDGKVKQRVVADLGRKDLLIEILPKLRIDPVPVAWGPPRSSDSGRRSRRASSTTPTRSEPGSNQPSA
jgi:hypothetical protein